MSYLKTFIFVGFSAALVGCGDSKAPPSLKQDTPKTAPGTMDKGMKTGKES